MLVILLGSHSGVLLRMLPFPGLSFLMSGMLLGTCVLGSVSDWISFIELHSFKRFIFYFVYVSFACMYVCMPCAWSACWDQKRALNSLELKLQTVASCCEHARIEFRFPGRAASTVKHWASLQPELFLLLHLEVFYCQDSESNSMTFTRSIPGMWLTEVYAPSHWNFRALSKSASCWPLVKCWEQRLFLGPLFFLCCCCLQLLFLPFFSKDSFYWGVFLSHARV